MTTPAATSHRLCFLYHSVMADTQEASCVADIVKAARQFNASQGLSGLLVFDGMRFVQYLEGPADALQALIERLQQDTRHTQFTTVWVAQLQGERRFAGWSMGYAYADEDDPLSALTALRGAEALDAFLAMTQSLDMA